MIVKETKLKGCFTLTPKLYNDERGYFFESFNKQSFEEAIGKKINFVQDNQSLSYKGVLRALHYQIGEYAQAKLVSVIKGSVLDVVVDLRPNSHTFGEHLSMELSEKNRKQLFIPKGFAHGFLVLSNVAEFFYKCDQYYNKEAEGGIIYDDPDIGIDWEFPKDQLILSEKDKILPLFKNRRL
ncbi:dTDP-4-dehydrorhamnose 3,5-epimerase [Eudoraea sp.]|uniref:dTDP-4-dehydrorhamnose 3,5-epimerase n=1 Tax=Eudoraea sp. TaxID=1979955 RepID=UPI003C773B43